MPTQATDNYYPSVQIVERAFQPGASAAPSVTAIAGFVGKSNQGPTLPTLVRNWGGFLSVYGKNYTDLHAAVSDYFNNGGQYAYINRISGSGATTSSVNVYANDAPEDPQNPGSVLPGTPPLFTLTALSPGSWGNSIFVACYARDPLNKRFDINVYNVPLGTSFDPTKRNSDLLLESWNDVTLDRTDMRYLYDVVNAPSATGSVNIFLSGQTYDMATTVRPYPNTVVAKQLSGGADGTYLSPFDQTAAYTAAINNMLQIPQPFVLNLPNITDPTIVKFAVTAAAARGDIFVILDCPLGMSSSDIVTYSSTTLALPTVGVSTPSYSAIYWPQVYLPSVGASAPGKVTLRPAGGAMAGLMMSLDASVGAFASPAGSRAVVAGASGLELKLTEADLTRCNNAHVNAIRQFAGIGVVPWGTRTLKLFGMDMYIENRRSIIFLREQLRAATQYALFQPNTPVLWQRLTNTCNTVLGKFWQAGGLNGSKAAEAYYTKCDGSNNTMQAQQQGQVNIEVGVALAAPAEFIIITIGQFDGSTSVSSSV